MQDCKHEHFVADCVVCWWKTANRIKLDNSPPQGKMTNDEYYQACLSVAIGIGTAKIEEYSNDNNNA